MEAMAHVSFSADEDEAAAAGEGPRGEARAGRRRQERAREGAAGAEEDRPARAEGASFISRASAT